MTAPIALTMVALTAFGLSAALCGGARAQIVTTEITGTVGANASPAQDIDTLGLFGPAGRNLNGEKMDVTLKFDSSQLQEGGMAPGYSAWAGPSGSCAIKIGGVQAKPSIDRSGGIDSSRVYLYSDYQGMWGLAQYAQSATAPNVCGVTVTSTKHAFVPGVNLVEAFSYLPPKAERDMDSMYLDITVNGVRETVSASVKSLTYGP